MSTKCDLQTFRDDELIACIRNHTNTHTFPFPHHMRLLHRKPVFYWNLVFSVAEISEWQFVKSVYKSMGWKTARFSLSLHSHTRLVFFANVCHTFIETYSFYCATESFSHGKFIMFVQTRLKCKGLHTGFDARRGRLLCLRTSYQLHSTRPEL